MPTTAPRYKQQGARAPGPKPPGCAQARTRGGRLAWVLGRNAKGWIAVELDGNANEEGKAYERKSLRWAQFAPGQDSILAAAPPDAPKAPEPPPPPPRARRQPKPTQRTPYEEPIDPHNT